MTKLATLLAALAVSLPASAYADATINGKAPADYYRQFVFHQDADGQHFYYLTSVGEPKVKGSDVELNVEVALQSDGSYRGMFSTLHDLGGGSFEHVSDTPISGNWHVDGDKLVVDGLGTASGLSYNGRDAAMIHVDRDDTQVILVMARSTANI